MDALTAPLHYDFMVKAIVISTFVGIVCALLSCFLVLKRWSLMGDAISHSVLPGVVIAYAVGLPYSIGALVFGLGSVLSIGYIKNKVRLKEDTVMGIIFISLFALGIVLISKIPSNVDLMHVLFGYVLGITDLDAIQTISIATAVSITIILLRKSILLYCFDPAHAKSVRINVDFYHYLLLLLLALTVVAAVQTVGIVLVIAMLIMPGAIAHLWTDNFDRMLIIATTSSIIACIAGAYFSYYFNVSTGGAMVLVLALEFLLTLTFAPKYGILLNQLKKV